MTNSKAGNGAGRPITRRTFMASAAATAATVALPGLSFAQETRAGIDPAKWTPEFIASIAGTESFDTAAECYRITPKDHKGRLTYWYFGPTQASSQIEHDLDREFQATFHERG